MISVQQLSSMLKNLSCQEKAQPKSKKARRKRKNKAPSGQQVLAIMPAPSASRKRRKNKKSKSSSGVLDRAEFTLTKKEYVKEVGRKVGEGDFYQFQLSTLAYAKNFSPMFERYRVTKASAIYVPSVGSTAAGNVVMGVDIDGATSSNITKLRVSQLERAVSSPVSKGFTIQLPVKHGDLTLATSKELLQVVWAVEKASGDLWISYTIDFFGCKPA